MAVLKIKDGNDWASITTIQGETGPAGTYTPGAGISIVNDEISVDIEYLTNSDILAIWNNNQ